MNDNGTFKAIELMVSNDLETILSFKPENITKDQFLMIVLNDLLTKQTAREHLISTKTNVFERVKNTLETIKSYPYFNDSSIEVRLEDDGKSDLITTSKDDNEANKQFELRYKLYQNGLVAPFPGDPELKNNLGDVTIKNTKEFTPYEKWLLDSFINTMTLSVINARKYEKDAGLDSLTGLLNRRFFDPNLEMTFRTCTDKSTEGLSLILLDLDHLKDMNSNHELKHTSGDILIKGFSKLLAETLSKGRDSLYRIGGDEFAILMPMTKMKNAYEKAKRIRDSTKSHSFIPSKDDPIYGKYNLPLLLKEYPGIVSTVSIGVAHSDNAGSSRELFETADSAITEAKKIRNEVIYLPCYELEK